MRILFVLISFLPTLALAIPPAPSMYADRVARQVGDVLTVQIVENTTATAVAGTNTKEEYDASLDGGGSGGLDFIPLFSGKGATKSEHKGDGRTVRQGRLTGKITAKVVEVFPNGNLRIEGQKSVIINGERQMTILTGVVRPEDIALGNVISSDLIADAEITFKGKGVLANTERPGFFARIFDWLF
ncbi:flagellar basal body L-ring protein FlgH [candidate division KSB1 bacterium]|nr:MAG: flagellar basal body L-ring protein FlgH [candidate division KSB1 bacterium]